jgi:hypothetical protein
MGTKPTFSLADDYVALMELGPAARTVYMLLRCNASFERNGVVPHSVHVTASWFTEMTSHWQKPMTAVTARRGLNELISKGVLIRLNEPQDGSGFVIAFVVDPRGRISGPTNGYDQAKKVAKRCGTKAYYQRLEDDMPGIPAVTGVRLGSQRNNEARAASRQAEENFEDGHREDRNLLPEVHDEPGPDSGVMEEQGDAGSPAAEVQTGPSSEVDELARLLVRNCHGKGMNRQGLLGGEAQRVAEVCAPAMEQGWSPADIASKLSLLVTDKIFSVESFLRKKAADLGTPPPAHQEDNGVIVVGDKVVDLGDIPWDGPAPVKTEPKTPVELPPSADDEATRERLAVLGRKMRRRTF